jgi:hypothetical protein
MSVSYVTDMRTTVRLDENLLRQAKRFAAETGRSLTAVIEDALREALARRKRAPPLPEVNLTTAPGLLRPGVNLDDSAGLLELMESDRS